MEQRASGAETNETKGSLVKAVFKEKDDRWKCPREQAIFYISAEAEFPEIKFELDLQGDQQCLWTWEINWAAATSGLRESKKRGRTIKHWSTKGQHEHASTTWTADLNGLCLGGTLTVSAKVGDETFKRSVRILGTNPTEQKIKEYIDTFDEIPGFSKIVATESKYKQFINADNEPVVAFDGGYGLTQLTNPSPKYHEAWSWKENIRAGVALYHQKRNAARVYLTGGKKKLKYTEDQLQLETWCMWNSGHYHKWDEKSQQWARDPNILGDSKTANIGWMLTKEENKGKSAEELHERDKGEYSKPPTENGLWRYTGIVYAEHIKNGD